MVHERFNFNEHHHDFKHFSAKFAALRDRFGSNEAPTNSDQKPKPEKPPQIKVASVEELGDVQSENTRVVRDLGFPGEIDGIVLLSYGDTMYKDKEYSDRFLGIASDSIAIATHDPLVVHDPLLNRDGYPKNAIPFLEEKGEHISDWALGITNVVQTGPGEGIIYFLVNKRPGGNTSTIMGAGIATVKLDTNASVPTPLVHRDHQWLWSGEDEPWWGDVGALRHEGYIYAYGHAKNSAFVYVCRVPVHSATNQSAYEYWNGEHWQKERLRKPGEKARVFWQINQGMVIYSEFYKCFMFVFSDNWWNSRVMACTALSPEGPFGEAKMLYQAKPIKEGGNAYAAAPHTYFDRTGKTLVITFTNMPNKIQAIRVTFDEA